MKIAGIAKAVEDFNSTKGTAVVWLSPGFGAVETRIYKEPLNFSHELCCRYIPLEVKGIGGIRRGDAQTSFSEVQSDIMFLKNSALLRHWDRS